MKMDEIFINLITEHYCKAYGNIYVLKDKCIKQCLMSSKYQKEILIERNRRDYDFLEENKDYPSDIPDDFRVDILNEYSLIFKYACILLYNSMYEKDFMNPFTGLKVTLSDIAEAYKYMFDVSSSEETYMKMKELHDRKKLDNEEYQRRIFWNQSKKAIDKAALYVDWDRYNAGIKEENNQILENCEYMRAKSELGIKMCEWLVAGLENTLRRDKENYLKEASV
jgi:hypothetical protein